MQLFTIGYSGRSLDEFIGMLREHEISVVADVRMRAGSRFKPEFSKGRLASSLWESSIAYVHLNELGNAGKFNGVGKVVIHNPERGYPELAALLEGYGSVAIMCLEQDPRECHRLVVAEEMVNRRPDLGVTHLGISEAAESGLSYAHR